MPSIMQLVSTLLLLTICSGFTTTEATPVVVLPEQSDLNINQDNTIPTKFQEKCGDGDVAKYCDRRTQLCSMITGKAMCEDCAIDICAFAGGKNYNDTKAQCQHDCPLYWKKLAAKEFCGKCADRCLTSTTSALVSSSGTESPDCADIIAKKDDEIHSLRSQVASGRTTNIFLAIAFSFSGVALICSFIFGPRIWAKIDNYRKETTEVMPDREELQTVKGDVPEESHKDDDDDDDADAGPAEPLNKRARETPTKPGTPRAPYYTARPDNDMRTST